MAVHSTISNPAEIHEAKQIAGAATSDAGKVITPSSTLTGQGELRHLTTTEISGLTAALAAKQDSITPQPAIPDLTDSTTGTPGATLAALPDPADTPVDADALRDDIVANLIPALRDNIASLNAELDKLKAALRATGIITP